MESCSGLPDVSCWNVGVMACDADIRNRRSGVVLVERIQALSKQTSGDHSWIA